MRLINADALEKTLGEWIRNYWTEAFTGDDAGSEFADMIEHAETIDANPTVHAYWIERRANNGNVHYTCSRCGKEVSYPYAKKRWKYCIACGAKMDGGVVYDYCNRDCNTLHEAYKKGREDVFKEIKEEFITSTRGHKK